MLMDTYGLDTRHVHEQENNAPVTYPWLTKNSISRHLNTAVYSSEYDFLDPAAGFLSQSLLGLGVPGAVCW